MVAKAQGGYRSWSWLAQLALVGADHSVPRKVIRCHTMFYISVLCVPGMHLVVFVVFSPPLPQCRSIDMLTVCCVCIVCDASAVDTLLGPQARFGGAGYLSI